MQNVGIPASFARRTLAMEPLASVGLKRIAAYLPSMIVSKWPASVAGEFWLSNTSAW